MEWLPFKFNRVRFRPKVFLFVVLPLILLLIGIAIYILYLPIYREREEMIFGFNALPQPLIADEADTQLDETADWQIDRNETLGVEIRYPLIWRSVWPLNGSGGYIGLLLPPSVEYMGKDITEYPISANINISFVGNADRQYQTMEEFFQEWDYSNSDIAANWNVSNVQQVVVNGVVFYKYSWMHQDMGETYLTFHDGRIISVRFSMSNLDIAQMYSDVVGGIELTEQHAMFKKFLSTFHFIQAGQPAEKIVCPSIDVPLIDGWKTYQNDKFAFQFQYPKDWAAVESKNPGNPYLVFVELGPEASIQEGGSSAVAVRNQTAEAYVLDLQKEFIVEGNTPICLGNKMATKYYIHSLGVSNIERETIVVQQGDVLIEFSIGDEEIIMRQILSTFFWKKI